MARAVLSLLFVVATIKTVTKTLSVREWWFYSTPSQVEGLLRVCQLLAILSLAVLFLVYSIPFGKNLRGILLGYGLFISWSVVWSGALSLPVCKPRLIRCGLIPFHFLYLLTLVVWTVHLWFYQPESSSGFGNPS